MKKKQKLALSIFGIALLVLISFIVVKNLSSLSVIDTTTKLLGEEGYQAYDPGLVNGVINPAKFDAVRVDRYVSGSVSAASTANYCASYSTYACGNSHYCTNTNTYTAGQYGGVIRSSGAAYFTVKDLYLNNFKADVVLGGAGGCYDSTFKGYLTDTISSSKGWSYRQAAPASNGYSIQPEIGTIEVKWDDYNTGHYQLYWRGSKVEEGFANATSPLTITVRTSASTMCGLCGTTTSTSYMYNMRIQNVFGCDPTDGEYLISRIFANGNDFNLANLKGFKRFCTQIPAIHGNAGVFGTSNQVYYSLAMGKTVPVADNEAWKVFYIGNASLLGVPPNVCLGTAFDYSTKNCSALTGIIDICPSDYTFANGMCVVQIENKIDYEQSAAVGSTKAKIVLQRGDTTAHNGNYEVFKASTPQFTGVTSNTDCIVNYPTQSDKWDIKMNSVPYVVGQTADDGFFKMKMTKFDASVYAVCGKTSDNRTYSYPVVNYICSAMQSGQVVTITTKYQSDVKALQDTSDMMVCTNMVTSSTASIPTKNAYQWQEIYELERIKPLAEVVVGSVSQNYDIVNGGSINIDIANKYGKPFYGTLAVIYQGPLGENTYYFKNMDIPTSGVHTTIPARTPSLGTVKVSVSVLMPINKFSIMASDSADFEYQVANAQGQTINDLNKKVENLTSIIYSKDMSIQQINDYITSLQLTLDEKASVISNLQMKNQISAADKETLVYQLTQSASEKDLLNSKIATLESTSSSQQSAIDALQQKLSGQNSWMIWGFIALLIIIVVLLILYYRKK